jgi:hypothetical protein
MPRVQGRPFALEVLTPRRAVEGFSGTTNPQVDITWEEAAECLDAEAKWLVAAVLGHQLDRAVGVGVGFAGRPEGLSAIQVNLQVRFANRATT